MQKKISCWIIIFVACSVTVQAQQADSARQPLHTSGAITITNKGISVIPTFTLGKPAAIFDLSVGKKKIFFEPQLRFALEGKPWSFLFWWRYHVINHTKFSLTLGAHPALNFRTENFTVAGKQKTGIVTRRYFAGELAPIYKFSKQVTAGIYYLYSRGIDKDAVRNTSFLTINAGISNIQLGKTLYARLAPQFYYLKQDGKDGVYFTAVCTVSHRHFPLSLQTMYNKEIQSNIPGSQPYLWNGSIIWSFNHTYAK